MIIHRHKSGKCLLVFHDDILTLGFDFLGYLKKQSFSNLIISSGPFCKIKYYLLGQERIIRLKRSLWRWISPASHTSWYPIGIRTSRLWNVFSTIQIPLYIRIVIGPHKYLVTYLHRLYRAVYCICWKFKFNLTPNYIKFYV